MHQPNSMKAVVLVEGESDRIAVETLALRRGRDLAAEGVTVIAIGGAHALPRALASLQAQRVAVLVGALDLDRVPAPLDGVLAHV